uniref:Uncharacterized protein n=1 Tax=Panagrolaimus superbus TaxID=310955 RepID=A0A914XWD8_9BILA
MSFRFEYGLANGMNSNVPIDTPEIMDYLPCRSTLRNHVEETVRALTPQFSAHVKHHIEEYGGAVSFDFTDKNSPYYVVFGALGSEFGEYRGPNSSASSVLKEFLEIMEKHGLSEETVKHQIVVCTDRGSNMIGAFLEYNRIDDVCHQMSILSKRVPDPYKNNWLPARFRLSQEARTALEGVSKLLKDCTKLIKAIK